MNNDPPQETQRTILQIASELDKLGNPEAY
jgi:hypothetical protein